MYDRTAIMRTAWLIYRRDRNSRLAFSRKFFTECLRSAWAGAKRMAAYAAELAGTAPQPAPIAAPVLSPMEARIDALKYLSARYHVADMERAIRAEYAHA